MPDPDPTRTIRVGENQNRNQPVLMVGLSGSGPSVFQVCSSRFQVLPPVLKFHWIQRDLADIWSNPSNLD